MSTTPAFMDMAFDNMTGNGSTPMPTMSPNSWNKMIQYTIYFVEGGTMFFGNMAVAMSIWYYKALRTNKGYFVFSFMFFCDSLNGLAQLFASVYRTSLLIMGTHDVLVTRWECMGKLHTFVWAFSEPCAAMMLAVISLDRVYLVSSPGNYFKKNTLTYLSISLPFVWNLTGVVVAFVTAYHSARVANVAKYCLLSFGLGKKYWAYHGFMSVGAAMLSILLYVVVILVNKRRGDASEGTDAPNKQMLKSQATLTKKLGASCLTTFFVYVIPRLVGTALDYSTLDRSLVSSLMMIFYWILGNFNAIINLYIFLRVPQIRMGVKGMLTGKKYPPVLHLWKVDSGKAAEATTVTNASKKAAAKKTSKVAAAPADEA